MFARRFAARNTRAIRLSNRQCMSARHQSTSSSSHTGTAATGAIAGATGGLLAVYAYYHISGAGKIVATAKETQRYVQDAQKRFRDQVQDKAPNPNEALKWLRQVATYYAGFLPGASGVVDTTFNDLDKIHDKHRDEVDKIVSEAYEELKGVSQQEMNLESAQQAWSILQKHLQRIMELAGDAAEDIINNHPQLKKAVGSKVDQLKQLGDAYGPDAKKQVEETWTQIQDTLKGGIDGQAAERIRKIVQEKVDQLKKMGEEAWNNSMEKAKPYLEKNPKVKEIVDDLKENALKQGKVKELFGKVKEATESGQTDDLEKYAKQLKDKAEEGTEQWDQYLKMVPGGGQLLSKIGQLQDIAKSKGPEAQKLVEDTVKELSDVLNKKSEEAKKLAGDAKDKTSR